MVSSDSDDDVPLRAVVGALLLAHPITLVLPIGILQ